MDQYTSKDIQSMSHHQRFQLRQKLISQLEVLDAVEDSDPDLSKVKLDDYRGQIIVHIAESAEGLSAMHDAIANGWPPLAGIDPMIRKLLGPFYRSENDGGVQAGYALWRVLKKLYEQGPQGSLPYGCTAKTGTTALEKATQ